MRFSQIRLGDGQGLWHAKDVLNACSHASHKEAELYLEPLCLLAQATRPGIHNGSSDVIQVEELKR